MRAPAAGHRYRLNALITDLQLSGDHLGGYRVGVGEDIRYLHVGDDDSDGEHGAQPSLWE